MRNLREILYVVEDERFEKLAGFLILWFRIIFLSKKERTRTNIFQKSAVSQHLLYFLSQKGLHMRFKPGFLSRGAPLHSILWLPWEFSTPLRYCRQPQINTPTEFNGVNLAIPTIKFIFRNLREPGPFSLVMQMTDSEVLFDDVSSLGDFLVTINFKFSSPGEIAKQMFFEHYFTG